MWWYPNISDGTAHKITTLAVGICVVVLLLDFSSIIYLLLTKQVGLTTFIDGLLDSRGSSRGTVLLTLALEAISLVSIMFRRKEVDKRIDAYFGDNPFKRDLKLGLFLMFAFLCLYHLCTVILPQNYRPWG